MLDAQRLRAMDTFLRGMAHVTQRDDVPPVVCTGGALLHLLYQEGVPSDIDLVSRQPNSSNTRDVISQAARIAAEREPRLGIRYEAGGGYLEFNGADGFTDRVEIDIHEPDDRLPVVPVEIDGGELLVNTPDWIVAKKIELVLKGIGDTAKHLRNADTYLRLPIRDGALARNARALLLTGDDAIRSHEDLNDALAGGRMGVNRRSFDRVISRLGELGVVPEASVSMALSGPARSAGT